jgi:Mrp family chromosome partitioning ATPase
VADTIHLASYVDGVILVIEAGSTKRRHVTRALELLANASVMGFVLNKAPATSDVVK